jgi:hypothetical protein
MRAAILTVLISGFGFAACGGALGAGAPGDSGADGLDGASAMREGGPDGAAGAGDDAVDSRSSVSPTGNVTCGDLNCGAPSHFCCLYDWPICIVTGVMGGPESCPSGRSQLYCDDRTDCEPGSVCCAIDTGSKGYAESICAKSCPTGSRSQILCDQRIPDACPLDRPVCSDDTQAIFQGKSYCHASSASSDGGAPLTPCQSIVQQDVTGTYYAVCRARDLPTPFAFAIVQKMNPDGLPSTFDMSLTPLRLGAVDPFDTVGDTVVGPPAMLREDCTFTQAIGTVVLPAAANALARDLRIEGFVLRGKVQTAERRCAEFDGTVPLIMLSAQGNGDVCVMIRVRPGSPAPQVSDSDFVCDPGP